MKSRERVGLLQEAAALEEARGFWTYAHVCAVTGDGLSTIRSSDCPRHEMDTANAVKGRARVVFRPEEVRAWMERRLRRAS
jgi:hypothetical protein